MLHRILLRNLTGDSRSGNRRACHFRRRRMLPERLEDRTLLVAYVVDTIDDDPAATADDSDGLISLREAIQAASTNAPFGDGSAEDGGAIMNPGELKIANSRLMNNEAWNSAGAVWNEGTLEIMDLSDKTGHCQDLNEQPLETCFFSMRRSRCRFTDRLPRRSLPLLQSPH